MWQHSGVRPLARGLPDPGAALARRPGGRGREAACRRWRFLHAPERIRRALRIGGAEFGDQPLHCVAFIAPLLATKIPVEARWMPGRVTVMPISA